MRATTDTFAPRVEGGFFPMRCICLLLLTLSACRSAPAGKGAGGARPAPASESPPTRTISVDDFADRVRGSLYGQ